MIAGKTQSILTSFIIICYVNINVQLFLLITLNLFTYSVTPVSENQLQTNQAYVLFYQRNSTTTIRK